jgi:hypothetical protein
MPQMRTLLPIFCFAPLAALVSSSLRAAELVPDLLQTDGLEFSTSAQLYRVSAIRIRDPHFIAPIAPPFLCPDFTDNDLPNQPGSSINAQIQASLDADSDGDGVLDNSSLSIFQAFAVNALPKRMDDAAGVCSAPAASSSCQFPSISSASLYQTQAAGDSCFEAIPGTLGNYTPAVGLIAPPCWVSAPVGSANLGTPTGAITLQSVRRAGAVSAGLPGTRVLLRGFLRESDANQILLPANVPFFGGQPITVLLKGGAGNACPGNDKDMFNGESGWWFYIEQSLTPVPTQSGGLAE